MCTEYCSIHPTSDPHPYAFAKLWNDDDVGDQTLMVEAVHRHGALAGVELWHGGSHAKNLWSRQPPLSASGGPGFAINHMQTAAMSKHDIGDLRRWQIDAAKRAKTAGFDIVYVYAGHDYLPFQFISARHNQRSDEYGGRLENRARLLREMIEDTREAVGDRCAVAVRFAVDELEGDLGVRCHAEGRDVIEMLAELPDLWDVNVSFVENDPCSARFSEEGYQRPYVDFVKKVTSKPVVGVGRFTSPDTMVNQLHAGVLDLIGAARPSIADPFLPRKVEQGRIEDIRECIGCNICRAANNEATPLRCTQNPTMGHEKRFGWHPERVPPKTADERILVVGAGPAGLECAQILGRRGYSVTVAEAGVEAGGRLLNESNLPGLGTWIRVRDYRMQQINQLTNVEIYYDSNMEAAHVREFGADRVVLATGASWRRDGVGRFNPFPIAGANRRGVFTPEDVMEGATRSPGIILLRPARRPCSPHSPRSPRRCTLMTSATTNRRASIESFAPSSGRRPPLSGWSICAPSHTRRRSYPGCPWKISDDGFLSSCTRAAENTCPGRSS